MELLEVEEVASSRSTWTVGGLDYLVITWTAEAFACLSRLDRRIVRRSRARRLADRSWLLLLLA